MIDPSVIPAIRVQQLLMVRALAEHNSFAAAATSLGTSQPTLSRALQKIERLVGARLFARNSRRVEITPAGQTFVALADRALSDLRGTLRGMTADGAAGTVTMSTCAAFAAQVLPRLLGCFRRTHRNVAIRVRERHQPDIIDEVTHGTADFGVGYVDQLPETVCGHILATEHLLAVVPLAHPIAASRPAMVHLKELADCALISLPLDTHLRRVTDLAAASCGVKLCHDIVVERAATIVSHVEAGVGIAILPASVLPPRPWRHFHTALVDPLIPVTIGIITAPRRYQARPAATMISLIIEDFEQADGRALTN